MTPLRILTFHGNFKVPLSPSLNPYSPFYLGVVQDWYKSIFQNEDSDPYPNSNGGQNKVH